MVTVEAEIGDFAQTPLHFILRVPDESERFPLLCLFVGYTLQAFLQRLFVLIELVFSCGLTAEFGAHGIGIHEHHVLIGMVGHSQREFVVQQHLDGRGNQLVVAAVADPLRH